jgi:hypothetical protein
MWNSFLLIISAECVDEREIPGKPGAIWLDFAVDGEGDFAEGGH